MGMVLILVACMVLLVLALGLPLLLRPDSPVPDILGGGVWAAMILYGFWMEALWWVLLPILALIGLTVWLDKASAGEAPLAVDRRGMSARTRLRFRLSRLANLAILALIVSLFVLPAGSTRPYLFPAMLIGMSAMVLFRFSFYRSWRRDADAFGQEGAQPPRMQAETGRSPA